MIKYNNLILNKIAYKFSYDKSIYKNKMIEIVWSVTVMVAILIGGVAWVLYYIFTYDKKYTS